MKTKTLIRIFIINCSLFLIVSSFNSNSQVFENGFTYKICSADFGKKECLSSVEPGQNTVALGKVIIEDYRCKPWQKWYAWEGVGRKSVTIFTTKKNGYNNITYNLGKAASYPTFNSWRMASTPESLYFIQLFRWPADEMEDEKNVLGCLEYRGLNKRVHIVPCELENQNQKWRFVRVPDSTEAKRCS